MPILILAACSRPPIEPIGMYRLGTADKTLVLDVRASGEYVLQIDGPDSMTDEIRGRWEDERGNGPHVSFHGLAWRGTEPEAGSSVWTTTVRSNAELCLDAEGQSCFTKDAAT
jgi:hypothetical protein